jgi:hypothetical protein
MADNTNRLAGTASLTVDGRSYALKGNFYYQPSGATREELMGLDGFHGYKETPGVGEIGGTLRDTGGLSVSDLGQMTNSTIVAELANGKTVVGRNMFTTERPKATADEAEVEIVWRGPQVGEV